MRGNRCNIVICGDVDGLMFGGFVMGRFCEILGNVKKRIRSKFCVDNIPDIFVDGMACEGIRADREREHGLGLRDIAGARRRL
jgi:hypothetical protein